MPWLTPARRRWIYGIATAVLPLLISLGWLDHEAAPLWLAVIGSVLVPGMAAPERVMVAGSARLK